MKRTKKRISLRAFAASWIKSQNTFIVARGREGIGEGLDTANETKSVRTKEIEKTKKFIKRLLSRHRRTSRTSDLFSRRFSIRPALERIRRELVRLEAESSKLPRNADVGYHLLFCQISFGTSKPAASEYRSYRSPFNRREWTSLAHFSSSSFFVLT